MAMRGKQRKFGNFNKIVRVRNERAQWMLQAISNRLDVTYQEAFEFLLDDLEARNAYTWEHLAELVDKIKASK